MNQGQPVQSRFRRARVAALVAVLGMGQLATADASAVPAASVAGVQATRVADVILLDGGFDRSLREGMVCRVVRGTADIAEVLLVEVRPNCSAALILSLRAGQAIQAGDVASVKILKT